MITSKVQDSNRSRIAAFQAQLDLLYPSPEIDCSDPDLVLSQSSQREDCTAPGVGELHFDYSPLLKSHELDQALCLRSICSATATLPASRATDTDMTL
jgi:hypothetical protein